MRSHPAQPAAVIFRDAWGEVLQMFDPAGLGLPADLVDVTASIFHIHDAGASPETRKARWRALRRFSLFLESDGVVRASDINAGTIQRYLAWLAVPRQGKRLSQNSIAGQYSLVRPLLDRIERNHPDLFGGHLGLPWNPFPRRRRDHKPKLRLPAVELKTILAACYEEIDEAWATFQRGQAIIALAHPPPTAEGDTGRAAMLWHLHRLGGGIAPGGTQLRASGFKMWELRRLGWQEGMARHYHLTPQTMAPFYIALAIQLAANRDPLRAIRRDCLVPHPIDEHRVMVEWVKQRTGCKPRLQRRSFDRRRPHSAPRLVEMLLAMTEPLVPHVPVQDRENLFLVRFFNGSRCRRHDKPAGTMAPGSIDDMVMRFIKRANARIAAWNEQHPERARKLLPRFVVGQLRGSVATQHYIETGGNLAAVGSILNHQSLVTTDLYVEGPSARKLERETIARLQKLMVAWVTAPPPARAERASDAPVMALFGHQCLAPMDERPDGGHRVCRHLGGCLTCPGLVVPLDAEHLARLLQAYRHLLDARERIDGRRWSLFYAPSLTVIEQDLLPAFPDDLHMEAERRIDALPALPDIE